MVCHRAELGSPLNGKERCRRKLGKVTPNSGVLDKEDQKLR